MFRLTSQQKAGQVCTYTLDGVGNLKTMWEGGNFPKTFTFNAADRLVTMVEGASLTTDAWTGYGALESEITGNSTTGYSYNGQDQLAVVTAPTGDKTTYSFDGDGLRRSVATTNVSQDPPTLDVTTMVWDGSDYLLLNEPTQNRVVLTLDSEIVSCGSKDLLTDPLGSLVKEISAGASLGSLIELYPYGTRAGAVTKISIPFVYIAAYGYYTDSAERDYVRARELYKSIGRWMQTDPIWPEEGPYGYVEGNPIRFADPSGMLKQTDCRQRTVKYCRDALANPSNSALRCFCRVSYLLCRFLIRSDVEDAQTRRCYNCINKCLFDHYLDRHNPSSPCWSVALDPKARACLYGGDECKWYIRCEQKTLTGCLGTTCRHSCPHGIPPPKGVPKGWPFPFNGSEVDRIRRGQELCCDPGKFGQVDAGIVPIPFPIEKWGHL